VTTLPALITAGQASTVSTADFDAQYAPQVTAGWGGGAVAVVARVCVCVRGRHHQPRGGRHAAARRGSVISDCHFAVQLNHVIAGFLSYPVVAFLK
jgi:hypothetical protein